MAAKTSAEQTDAPARERSIPEIEADIAAARDSLVQTVDQLQGAVKETLDPKRIIAVQISKVRSVYIDEYGGIRPERVVITVGVVVGAIAVRGVFKRVFKKS